MLPEFSWMEIPHILFNLKLISVKGLHKDTLEEAYIYSAMFYATVQ